MLYLSKSLKSRDRPSLCTAPPPPLRSVKIREAMAWTSLWTGLSSLFFPKQRACSQARLGQTHDTRVNKSWQLIPIKICQCCYKSRISASKDDQDYFFKILRFINRLNFCQKELFFFHQMRFKICRCNHFFLKKNSLRKCRFGKKNPHSYHKDSRSSSVISEMVNLLRRLRQK